MGFGKPLKFKTVEELQEKIDAYFASCDEENEPITITGLALALDTSRETLCNYEEKEDYFDTIKKAKLKVENAYEKRLVRRGNGGDVFALKNFGWKDTKELDGNIDVTQLVIEAIDDATDDDEAAAEISAADYDA
jgi:hypothetical protein